MNLQSNWKILLCVILCTINATLLSKDMAINASLVQLIKATRSANHYWATLEHNKLKRFTETTPWNWLSTISNESIQLKRKQLQETEQELAELLGTCIEGKNIPTKEVASRTVFKAKKTLDLYNIPSHPTRNWIKYSLIAGTIIGGYIGFQKWMNSDILFIFNTSQPIKTLIDGSLTTKKYSYTRDQEHQYLRISKEDASIFTELFKAKDLSFITRTPTTKDSLLFLYDQDGNNIIKTFYEKNGAQPIQNIKKILFKEQPNERMFVQDTNYQEEKFIEALDNLIAQAHNEKRFELIVKKHIKDTPYEKVSFETKRNILFEMILKAHQEIPEHIKDIFEKFFKPKIKSSSIAYKKELDTMMEDYMNARTIGKEQFEKNGSFFSLAFQAHALHIIERDIQLSIGANKANDISEKINLNIELMATIPAILCTYGIYKLGSFIGSKLIGTYILKPLKQDLIHFQLMLNKERHVTKSENTSTAYKGMCYYWVEQCKKYITIIPEKQRASFIEYSNQLKNPENTPQQKLTIIECMFREFEFLH